MTNQPMISFKYPLRLMAGDESAELAINLAPSKNTIRVSFLWGEDEKIRVLGANMVKPNVFEFPPHKEVQKWYLKYCVSQESYSCQKDPYLTVHELKSNLWPIYVARGAAVMLFLFPIIVLMYHLIGGDFYNAPEMHLGIGPLVISLPITFIILFVTWSSKVTEFIKRLFSFSTEITVHYSAKGVSKYEPLKVYRPSRRHKDNNNESNVNRVCWSEWHDVF